ncbi:hypothetical protein FTW19_16410 [Terriglobus albidus]|uniref:Uncharacterized protein n=1 Tax=Terriglobus albidus TaxID=1592106 RepID=A0A5B9ECF2_9BACT|nr:hypothetical protein [Terriglobus albidus]QEE29439.1 hypothetical protein FTW19_16410 [Terriglobus albidus]
MSITKTDWAAWQPVTAQDRETVLREMESILASPHFCNSKRYPALLRYVVESSLNGRGDLKERTLGIEVFQRPADYDTNADTIVRFTAGEVRKRLSLYYRDHSDGRLQIVLPTGSYTPEFLLAEEEPAGTPVLKEELAMALPVEVLPGLDAVPASSSSSQRRRSWIAGVSLLLLATVAVSVWRFRPHRVDVVDQFWRPVASEGRSTLLCPGGVVFAPERASGVATAGKDIQYPFVSMQIATSIGQLGGLLQREGVRYEVQSSVALPLTELRDRPVVLLGGYNNDWSIRLLSDLRYHFSTEPEGIILDKQDLSKHWERDRTRSYSSADDYALVARFRNQTTGNIVVVLAGLGRNGTEAATEFVSNPDYLEWLKQQIGDGLGRKNIEVVLKTSVIDGKTGAPSVEAFYTW